MQDSSNRDAIDVPSLFIWLLAMATIWVLLSSGPAFVKYVLTFDVVQTPATLASILTALLVAMWPGNLKIVLVFAIAQIVVVSVRLPGIPTHVVMELLVYLSIVSAFVIQAIKQRSSQLSAKELFVLYAPSVRWLLIIMYFFGTFHKLNPGFFSLHSSCAIPFLQGLPLPAEFLQHPIVGYSAIWGTLLLEFIAMLLLLSARTKYYGMLLGMPLHFMIGISSHAILANFSTFAVALHCAFLPAEFQERMERDTFFPSFIKKKTFLQFFTLIVILAQFLAMYLQIWWIIRVSFACVALTFILAVFRNGKMGSEDRKYRLVSPIKIINIFPLLFFINCLGPYIGLSTQGVVQMFSGLRTEGGVSNHYLIPQPLYLFPYQEKVVYIEQSQDEILENLRKEHQGAVWIDFQRYLFREGRQITPPLILSINDERIVINDDASFQAFAKEHFQELNLFERKLLNFRLVDEAHPRVCRH